MAGPFSLSCVAWPLGGFILVGKQSILHTSMWRVAGDLHERLRHLQNGIAAYEDRLRKPIALEPPNLGHENELPVRPRRNARSFSGVARLADL